MKIVLLDGNKIKTIEALHEAFARELNFSAWYGANLDALYDSLTEATEEIGVITVNTDRLAENLGKQWDILLRLLEDIKEERTGFYVCVEPFEK